MIGFYYLLLCYIVAAVTSFAAIRASCDVGDTRNTPKTTKVLAWIALVAMAPVSWPFTLFGACVQWARSRALAKELHELAGSFKAPPLSQTAAHYHKDEWGFLHACYHKAKTNYVGFFLGVTLSFPIEHYLYEKVWPFTLITKWLLD